MEEACLADNAAAVSVGVDDEAETPLLSARLSVSSNVSEMDKSGLAIPSDVHDTGIIDSEIPGLDSSVRNENLSGQLAVSSSVSTDLEDASQEKVAVFSQKSPLNSLPSMSTDRSDELSPKGTLSDVNSLASSTATSVGMSHHFVVPKMSAPVVYLADDEKDNLQKSAFVRVVEAYKHVTVSGGSQIRSSLLAHLGVEVVTVAS